MEEETTVDERYDEQQLVIFDLSNAAYGVDISTVREIIRMQEVTPIPHTPDYVEGVINLRGSVIPILDLRKRFGLELGEETAGSRIVVVDIGGADAGVMVDGVTEVLSVNTSVIEPPAETALGTDSEYVIGVVRLEQRLVILLDLARVLSDERWSAATGAAA